MPTALLYHIVWVLPNACSTGAYVIPAPSLASYSMVEIFPQCLLSNDQDSSGRIEEAGVGPPL